MNEYYKMKNNLKKILNENESKFSFTIDGWTAPNFEFDITELLYIL